MNQRQRRRQRSKKLVERRRLDVAKTEQALAALAGYPPPAKYKGWRGRRPSVRVLDEPVGGTR